MTVKELKKECKEKGLKGYSKLKKAELVKLLAESGTLAKQESKVIVSDYFLDDLDKITHEIGRALPDWQYVREKKREYNSSHSHLQKEHLSINIADDSYNGSTKTHYQINISTKTEIEKRSYSNDYVNTSINVSKKKSIQTIASEVEKRLIAPYLPYYSKVVNNYKNWLIKLEELQDSGEKLKALGLPELKIQQNEQIENALSLSWHNMDSPNRHTENISNMIMRIYDGEPCTDLKLSVGVDNLIKILKIMSRKNEEDQDTQVISVQNEKKNNDAQDSMFEVNSTQQAFHNLQLEKDNKRKNAQDKPNDNDLFSPRFEGGNDRQFDVEDCRSQQ